MSKSSSKSITPPKKRIAKAQEKAKPQKRGKKLTEDEIYFTKSQEKIDKIRAVLRTAKRDKLPVKERQ